jgi:hypothetical protein
MFILVQDWEMYCFFSELMAQRWLTQESCFLGKRLKTVQEVQALGVSSTKPTTNDKRREEHSNCHVYG